MEQQVDWVLVDSRPLFKQPEKNEHLLVNQKNCLNLVITLQMSVY